MSEFKFACPVCGQHITADSSASGTQLDCPTCFQKIIVPQAPTADSKLILSAARPSQKRISADDPAAGFERRTRGFLTKERAAVLLLLLALAAAASWFAPQLVDLAKRLTRPAHAPVPNNTAESQDPDGVRWTLNLSKARIPQKQARGSIHARPFACDHATVVGGTLLLRQGTNWPPELAVAMVLPLRTNDTLAGKSFEFDAAGPTNRPVILLGWKDEQGKTQRQDITNGYALKLAFGSAASGRIPGSIFVALPDEKRSVVAGTFTAEVRQPRPRR